MPDLPFSLRRMFSGLRSQCSTFWARRKRKHTSTWYANFLQSAASIISIGHEMQAGCLAGLGVARGEHAFGSVEKQTCALP